MDNDLTRGVENLVFNCAGVKTGDRVLLISEEHDLGYCDAEAIGRTIEFCRQNGTEVEDVLIPFQPENAIIPDEIRPVLQRSDIVICFSRLIDQLRFEEFEFCRKCIVNYAATRDRLASAFGAAPHEAFEELKRRIEEMIIRSGKIEVTCPNGTDFSGSGHTLGDSSDDVKVRRFPMLIFTPVLADHFSGRVAMPGLLIGTGRNFYSPYGLQLGGTIQAVFEDGRLKVFEGKAEDVERAERHLDRVSARFGTDRNFVHSWHAGIHPANYSPVRVFDDPVLWSNSAFGNPRILHFHTCGRELPGEISWNVLDPTIRLDGIAVWENGRLMIDRIRGGTSIIERFPSLASLFANPQTFVGL